MAEFLLHDIDRADQQDDSQYRGQVPQVAAQPLPPTNGIGASGIRGLRHDSGF